MNASFLRCPSCHQKLLIEMENDRQRELIQMMNDQLISLRLRNIELRVQLEELSHLRKEIHSLKKKHPAPTLRGEGCVAQGPA